MNLSEWLYKNKIISSLIVLWGLGLTTFVTIRVFSVIPPDIPLGTATAFATLFSLPALAIGLYKWRVDKHVEVRSDVDDTTKE